MTNRREFLKQTAGAGAVLGLVPSIAAPDTPSLADTLPGMTAIGLPAPDHRIDLTPASWIWYPSTRTLPNTVVLFRRRVNLPAPVRKASGWITADSRYLLVVNGQRVQWGPAPSDPRRMEVDPLELTTRLVQGENVIAATVLYYGHGDGTHPIGKPGFICTLTMECTDGSTVTITSNQEWQCRLATSWPAGQYKRWYVRSFQEEFDARLYPYGWDSPGFVADDGWIPPMILPCASSLPPICSRYPDSLMDATANRSVCCLLPRSIPLLRESTITVSRLREASSIIWKRPPREYFAMAPADAYAQAPLSDMKEGPEGMWHFRLDRDHGIALTFELTEQIVGFPEFTINAPEGTVVELLVHEAHAPGGPALLNTHFHAWARFTCRQGVNRFRCFDFESLRWLQLHVHGTDGDIAISNVGVLRRLYPWPNRPEIVVAEPPLQRLMDACVNTLYNSAQETFVDGMGRERQQYSGDGSHQMHGAYLALGETRLPARFISTFSQGLMIDGYFFDCWPAYDRLARVMERQLDMTPWGPLLDHGVGFGFDCYHHYLYSGDLSQVSEAVVRLQRFVAYLHRIAGSDGLLPVMNLGLPAVWIDHYAFKQQRHKQCAFNLYAAAMLRHAFAPLADATGNPDWGRFAQNFADRIISAAQRAFWSTSERLFVNNLPWRQEEGGTRMCDRSLATAVLFELCPNNDTAASLDALANCPPTMGLSYPANAGWRYWALAEGGNTDVILKEFRNQWALMDSVRLNNTIAEIWNAQPDSGDLWSHCAIVPLYVTFMSIAGIRPAAPGFARCTITPRPGDLEKLELTARTIRGDIAFRSLGPKGNRELRVRVPAGIEADLRLDRKENVALTSVPHAKDFGYSVFRLPAGKETVLQLKYT
jgi:alpha-L-rhamnosidase